MAIWWPRWPRGRGGRPGRTGDARQARGYSPAMTWVDGIALLVIAASAIVALGRGFAAEALGLAAWVGAAVAAFLGEPHARPHVAHLIDPPWLLEAVVLGTLFLAALVVLKLIGGAIAAAVRRSALGGLDRTLGLVFGVARGAVLLCLAYVVAGIFVPQMDRWPPAVREAAGLPYVMQGATLLVELLPEELRPRLPAGPEAPGRSATERTAGERA